MLERARELVLLGPRQRLRLDLELAVAAVGLGAAALDDGVAVPTLGRVRRARRSTDVGCGRLEVDLAAALEVDAEVEALDAERDEADRGRPRAEIANQIRRLPMKSIFCQRGIFWALAPMNAGLSNQLEAARGRRAARASRATAVNIEMSVPISSMSAKPLHAARRDRRRARTR